MIALLLSVAFADPLEGRVMEHGTGDPIAGAEVFTEGVDAVFTGPDGRFTIELPAGEQTLTVLADAHEMASVQLVVPLDKPLHVYLLPLEEYEIVVESFQPTAHLERHVVDAEMALETPGALDDSVRLVQSLPGVTVRREYAPGSGDLSVRGSVPGDNRYYLDGVEIPYLYHFNDYASVFPTAQLEQLELFPSTFGATYGDAVGAVVEAKSKLDRPEAIHGSASLNFVMAGAELRAPIGRAWSLSASGRRSYQDLVGEGSSQYTVWPVFDDFALRATHHGDKATTSLFVTGAGDGYTRAASELDVLDPVEASDVAEFAYSRRFQVAGALHAWDREGWDGRFVAAVVHDGLSGVLDSGGAQREQAFTLASRLDLRGRARPWLELLGGYELLPGWRHLEVSDPGYDAVLVAEEAPALARGVEVDRSMLRLRGGVYGEAHVLAGPVRIMPGVRVAFDTEVGGVRPEPRLAVKWRAAEQTEIQVAVGRYTQPPRPDLVMSFDLPITRSWQAGAGLEQTIANRLELGLDAYGKQLTDVIVDTIDGPPEVAPVGRQFGVELTARYRIREIFFLWSWLGAARSLVDDGDGFRPGDGDQPLTAGIVASWNPSRAWNLGVRYRYGSGLPWTSIQGSVYDAGRDAWDPVLGPINDSRFPGYHKLDLHAAWTRAFDRWSLSLTAELWFVPKSSAQLYPTFNYDYREQGWVQGPTIFPIGGARVVF